jgi:arylsulfatase A-like enzyme
VTLSRRQLFGMAAPAVLARAAATNRPPNLLFVMADDQRWNTLGCMGNPIIQTPTVDRLARNGTVFENAFVTTSICCVSRASVFTGLYERCHGIHDFATPIQAEDRPNTYYNLLREAGYRTGFIGKYGVGNQMPEQDFDYWRGFPGQGKYEVKRNGKVEHLTTIMSEQALEFVDSVEASKPFCLSISPKSPHADDPEPRQYIPEPDLAGLYKDAKIPRPPLSEAEYFDRLPEFLKNTEMHKRWGWRFTSEEQFQTMVKNYYRLITGVDRMLGRLLERLTARGLADNTVVIYTSDNGYFLGERGWADKWMMYEPSIRIPLVVWDGRRANAKPQRRREMALNIDHAPTLLDYAGVKAPVHVQGRSVRPLAENRKWVQRRDFFYEHHFETKNAVIPPSEGIRSEQWKYIRYLKQDPVYEELYNLRRDPNEKENLIGSNREEAARMRDRWSTWHSALDGWKRGETWREP